jgi:UDP-N-acetylglucosamine--N-acetylmuramyl-(pentapeptide) pyrophosphoryl-undecaprenol N-acetylglucosamine transferase
MNRAINGVADLLRERKVDVVVGFGGYVASPAYLAARRAGVPIAIHEANAKPGLANRLGARMSTNVGVAFAGTSLPHAQVVGMPLRREIVALDRSATKPAALELFGLDPERPTLLVTGGSLGARRINQTLVDSAAMITSAGWQVLHITGNAAEVADPGVEGYHMLSYCDRMDLALSVADAAVSRAGAATVSELSALGIPAAYVPYPVGNGEQRFNAANVVEAGGGILVDDAAFLPDWVASTLLAVLIDPGRISAMGQAARSVGVLDGTERMIQVIDRAGSPPTAGR